MKKRVCAEVGCGGWAMVGREWCWAHGPARARNGRRGSAVGRVERGAVGGRVARWRVAAPAEVALFRVLAAGVPRGPRGRERWLAYEALARVVVFEGDVGAAALGVFHWVVMLAGLYEE